MRMTSGSFRLLLVMGLCGISGLAQAWPFGESDESKAEKIASQANTQVQTADEFWRLGSSATNTDFRVANMSKAVEIYQSASALYTQAEQLSPNLQDGLIRLRISYCSSQIAQIQTAIKPKPEPRVLVTHPPELARGMEGRIAPDEKVPEISPEEVPRELAKAQQLLVSTHPEDAVKSLVKILRVDPANRRALLLMATVRVQQGRYDDAIVTIEGLRDAGEDEAVLLLASGAYCGAGRYFDALLALDKVMKKNPDLPQAHINMAYLLLEMGPEKHNDAETYYKYALKLGIARDAALEKRLGLKP